MSKVGQEATIRLNFMNARSTPMLSGTVIYISADAVPDKAGFNASLDGNSRDIYLARIRMEHRGARRSCRRSAPWPACRSRSTSAPATGRSSRTWSKPITGTMARAFSER